ncbi:hypothetical protein Tco_0692147 [Tanacetum coccineum]
MDATAQNTNNTTIRSILQQEKLTGPNFTIWYRNLRIVLRSEGKLAHLEQPLISLPYLVASQAARDAYNALYDAHNEVACLMLGGSLILNSLNKDYDQFVQNYNMHSMGKTIAKLHAMLKLHEKGIPKKGLRRSKKLKHRALSLYIGNGMRPAVETIGNFDLIIPSGLIIDDTKSQTGYVFVLNGGAVDWKSAKQSTTAMSSIEAEYITAAEALMEAIWMRIAADPGFLKGAIHFQRKYHYIHKVIQESKIVLKKVHTNDNVADPFTKPMSYDKHYEHAMAIGIVPASSLM